MTISQFDQMLFDLACGHQVVLGRLDKADTWTCEICGKVTELGVEPHRTELERDRDTAEQIDKQARERGETIERAGSPPSARNTLGACGSSWGPAWGSSWGPGVSGTGALVKSVRD